MGFLKTAVTKNERLGPEYCFIEFESEAGEITGDPGQFVMIRGDDFGTDPILPRAFSLVTAGRRGAVLVKTVGKATRRLAAMHVGDALTVFGPLGNSFSLPDAGARPLLVAGGVGVAPLLFLAERLRETGRDSTFVYGGRTRADLLFLDRIAALAGDLSVTTEDGSLGERGRVTDLVPAIRSRYERLVAYSCGPEPMLKALHHAVTPGIPLQVALEQAMACGMGTCKGCAVHDSEGRYKYVCSDGPVFASTDIFGGDG